MVCILGLKLPFILKPWKANLVLTFRPTGHSSRGAWTETFSRVRRFGSDSKVDKPLGAVLRFCVLYIYLLFLVGF